MSIVITGSIAYDYLMTFSGKFREQILPEKLENLSLSFLVDSMKRERRGVAANIAYTLKLLGGEPLLFATVGLVKILVIIAAGWLNKPSPPSISLKLRMISLRAFLLAQTKNKIKSSTFIPAPWLMNEIIRYRTVV